MSDKGIGFGGLFITFLFGATAGAATALLLAPETGPATRRRLKSLAADANSKAARIPGVVKDAYGQVSEVAKDAFMDAYSASAQALKENGKS